MNSSRLPGKTLMMLGDYSLLDWVVIRTQMKFLNSNLVVATGDSEYNQELIRQCKNRGISVIVGSENDVVDRFCKVFQEYEEAEYVIRICADNPFVSSNLMHEMIESPLLDQFDLIHSMKVEPEYPIIDGFGSELIKISTLKEMANLNLSSYDREHVTSYLYKNPEKYKIGSIKCPGEYNFPNLSLDIDTYDDYHYILRLIKFGGLTPYSKDIDIVEVATTAG